MKNGEWRMEKGEEKKEKEKEEEEGEKEYLTSVELQHGPRSICLTGRRDGSHILNISPSLLHL